MSVRLASIIIRDDCVHSSGFDRNPVQIRSVFSTTLPYRRVACAGRAVFFSLSAIRNSGVHQRDDRRQRSWIREEGDIRWINHTGLDMSPTSPVSA